MNPASDPLAQLRDIHLPSTVGVWPPAPGWWILAILIIAASLLLWRTLRARRQACAYRRDAIALLQQHWTSFKSDGNRRLYLQNLQVALRRIALSFAPNSASLTGDDWLNFLDSCTAEKNRKKQPEKIFQSELGQILLTEAYRQTPRATDAQLQELQNLALDWARRHTPPKHPAQKQGEPQNA